MGQSKVVINFGMQIWRFLYYIHLEVQIHFHAIQKLYFIQSQVLCYRPLHYSDGNALIRDWK